ncbi:S8 family serine peptidase [Streptomyces erythrochromogenes]|uniref:S8 family peptidase n=1 Tax=Streptomyces erythrochromogenes TaxID=285574 RepID=UPI00341C6DEC
MSWIRRSAAISTVLMVTLGGVSAAFAGPGAGGSAPDAGPEAQRTSATVRLITGDRVTVTSVPGGRHVVSVAPGPGRERVSFRTQEDGDKALTVIPSDAQALVAAGTLDRRLFNLTELIAQGLDEAHAPSLPLIVSSKSAPAAAKDAERSKATAAAADRLMAFRAERAPAFDLESIGARSVQVAGGDLGRFWEALNSASGSDAARAAVTPRISLDGRVKAVLDRSTAQVAAPAAWKAGYEGRGVKVAVLDTGVDDKHPDLAGRIAQAKDFSNSGNTGDRFGHGTHVAATVGGTGGASGGAMRGVAPQADLLVGKVLNDSGFGTEASVIEGMEWAAGQDAKVINMSLGGGPSDGTDPMSQAVNALTESTGALFVVAAGNDGRNGRSTVNTPGSADAALTVGAVDRNDALADFSSRGPRPGDGAAKPEMTAPGVGIVAARAAGTTMGSPVNAQYVAASGTSMATPHVAGAAAILAQQHPDWNARQLKDALVSTSKTVPGTKVTEQGGGRLDLAAATGPLTASGSLAFSPVEAGGETAAQKQTVTVRYTNTGTGPLTLGLGVALATDGGQPIAAGAVRLGSGSLTLAPGAVADVPLHLDPAAVARGNYYGYVTAKSPDGTVLAHTTVSVVVKGKQHRLTVSARDRKGQNDPGRLPNIWSPSGQLIPYTDLAKGTATVEEGTYILQSGFFDETENGGEAGELIVPDLKVTKDTTAVIDASDVTEVKIRTPRPAEQRGRLSTQFHRQIGDESHTWGHLMFDTVKHVYVSRVAPVTDGAFEFTSRWQMVAPDLEARVPGTSLQLAPYYEENSPVFGDQGARLTAVDAGTGAAPDFRHVRGKLAVVRVNLEDDTRALAGAAKAAGAEALMVSWPKGVLPWTRWRPDTERLALPTMRVPYTQGSALLERAGKGAVVEFSGTVRSPYLYDVMQVSKGSVPKELVHTVSEQESAVIRTAYTRTGASEWSSEQRFGWRPYQDAAWDVTSRFVPVGRERVEYVSGGDTLWSQTVRHTPVSLDTKLGAGMRNLPRTYRPGEKVSERWHGAPARPSIPRGAPWASTRTGDTLSVYIPEFTDSATGHYGFYEIAALPGGDWRAGRPVASAGDTSQAVLYRNGQRIAESDDGAWGDFEVPAGDAEYRLDLTTARPSPDWNFGTGTHTSWTFRSKAAAGTAKLPLLQVDTSVPTDLRNAVGPDRSHVLGLSVRMQDGMPAPRGTSVKVETSYDGGRTWTTADTDRKGDGFTATVKRPHGVTSDAYVTLRVTAKDSAGNSVRQTVDRAYLHPARR